MLSCCRPAAVCQQEHLPQRLQLSNSNCSPTWRTSSTQKSLWETSIYICVCYHVPSINGLLTEQIPFSFLLGRQVTCNVDKQLHLILFLLFSNNFTVARGALDETMIKQASHCHMLAIFHFDFFLVYLLWSLKERYKYCIQRENKSKHQLWNRRGENAALWGTQAFQMCPLQGHVRTFLVQGNNI